MKKILAFLTALCLMLSTSIVAFADDTELVDKSQEIGKELQSIVDYLGTENYMVKDSYTVDDAVNLYYLLERNYQDVEVKNTKSFVDDVKNNLAINGGKLIPSFGENMTTYAATISILWTLQERPDNFCGYNLYDNFYAMDPTQLPASPYYYSIIIPLATWADDSEFRIKVCDTLIDNYYVQGKGMDYYGFSCDNTAFLLSAISAYFDVLGDSERYKDVIVDCLNIIESYKTDGGYMFNPEYGTEPNCNSTALALMAYCDCCNNITWTFKEYDFFAKANEAYDFLQNFKTNTSGAYSYMKGTEPSTFASADVLRALVPYRYMVSLMSIDDNITDNSDSVTDELKPEDDTTQTVKTSTSSYPKSPKTGNSIFGVALGTALCCAVIATLRKKNH